MFAKRFLSLMLSAVLALSVGVSASAAASSSDYSVSVQGNYVNFIRYGQTAGSYLANSNDLTLMSDEDGDLLVCFHDTQGAYRGITLGSQTFLTIGGTVGTLTMNKSLSSKVQVNIATGGKVTTMNILGANPVFIDGAVTTLNLKAAAYVIFGNSGSCSKVTSTTKNAIVEKMDGTRVSPTIVSSGSSSSSSSSSTNKNNSSSSSSSSNPYTIRLKTKPINAEEGDTLSDLLDELNDNVEAYDAKTGDYLDGECKWNLKRSTGLDEDGTFAFTFYPDEKAYDPTTGKIKIYVDGISEDIDLYTTTGEWSITVPAGTSLNSCKKYLKEILRAENDDGEEVKGTIKWDKSGSTKVERSRSYDFTFDPSQSRYDPVEDSVMIYVEED